MLARIKGFFELARDETVQGPRRVMIARVPRAYLSVSDCGGGG
jgi:hypothetical protein